MQGMPEVGVLPHPVAVAADGDEVAVVYEAIDKGSRHNLIAEDLAPFLKALIRGEHGRGVLLAPRHELEEEHRAGAADRQIADLVDDEERRMREHLQTRL